MSYQDGRCFFCAYAKDGGHNSECPIGYPSKHHYKKLWWSGYLRGLGGRAADTSGLQETKDQNVYTMGWIQGTEFYQCLT